MAAQSGKQYKFKHQDVSHSTAQNNDDEDVALVQAMLNRFGHLKEGYQPGHFCDHTKRAVRRYQRFFGLTVDGIAGPQTKKSLSEPRCGLPDFSDAFVLRGCKYETRALGLAFVGGTPDLPGNQERDPVRAAFAAWASVTPLTFTEILPAEGPHFRISWESGTHGDGDDFDGPGQVIAHAFYPPPCGGPHAGLLHFDEDETWTTDTSGIHLQAVAIHEIGHLLGLRHSVDNTAIMYPTYSSQRLQLGQDDIAGIQQLYGADQITLQGKVAGQLSGTGATARFLVTLPSRAAFTLDGPRNADFDLYVKRDDPPTLNDFDLRAWTTSADESLSVSPATPGAYHILVHSYAGQGAFELSVRLI